GRSGAGSLLLGRLRELPAHVLQGRNGQVVPQTGHRSSARARGNAPIPASRGRRALAGRLPDSALPLSRVSPSPAALIAPPSDRVSRSTNFDWRTAMKKILGT